MRFKTGDSFGDSVTFNHNKITERVIIVVLNYTVRGECRARRISLLRNIIQTNISMTLSSERHKL